MRHVIVWATEEYVLAVDSGDIPFTFNKSLEEVRKTFSTLAHDPPEHKHIGPVCFGFWQLLATKSCCRLPNAQLFSQLL
jgi:hypothetical protein